MVSQGLLREATGHRESKARKHYATFFTSSFPFLFTQNKLCTCVKLPWKIWHSAARFHNQLWRLMLFCDTLLRTCKKKMQGLVEISGVFSSCFFKKPKHFIRAEKDKCWRALFPQLPQRNACFLTLFTSNLVSSNGLTASWWTPTRKWSSDGLWSLKWVKKFGIGILTYFTLLCSVWQNMNLRLTINILLNFRVYKKIAY